MHIAQQKRGRSAAYRRDHPRACDDFGVVGVVELLANQSLVVGDVAGGATVHNGILGSALFIQFRSNRITIYLVDAVVGGFHVCPRTVNILGKALDVVYVTREHAESIPAVHLILVSSHNHGEGLDVVPLLLAHNPI